MRSANVGFTTLPKNLKSSLSGFQMEVGTKFIKNSSKFPWTKHRYFKKKKKKNLSIIYFRIVLIGK